MGQMRQRHYLPVFQLKVKHAELSKAVEALCQVMTQRTAGSGFPVLLDYNISITSVMAAVQRVVGPALLYTNDGKEKNEATSAEVEIWLRNWKRGDERRVFVTDVDISRGWEAPAVMVIAKA